MSISDPAPNAPTYFGGKNANKTSMHFCLISISKKNISIFYLLTERTTKAMNERNILKPLF